MRYGVSCVTVFCGEREVVWFWCLFELCQARHSRSTSISLQRFILSKKSSPRSRGFPPRPSDSSLEGSSCRIQLHSVSEPLFSSELLGDYNVTKECSIQLFYSAAQRRSLLISEGSKENEEESKLMAFESSSRLVPLYFQSFLCC